MLSTSAALIATQCPVCQMSVEVYQGQINKKDGTRFNIRVAYRPQRLSIALVKMEKIAETRTRQ